jgi:tRNA-uridine 2-sulfurtransferase
VIAARETCHALGLPHVTLDLREGFRSAVVAPFVAAYARGETPNPCGRCNGDFRFAELLAFADRAGAAKLWTGHYARIVERGGRRLLARAVDPDKDQSYMLAPLEPAALERIEFPLGVQSKAETRAEAAAAGLEVAARRESQEACFLAGDDYRAFLERQGLAPAEGAVVDEGGRELGRHDGVWRFTPGQRRGIGVAAAEPLYALRTDAATNTLVVGPRGSLACTAVEAAGALHVPVERAEVKLRYRSAAVPARVSPREGGFTLLLDRPAFGVATGQIAALYDDEGAVVGCGVISSAGRH